MSDSDSAKVKKLVKNTALYTISNFGSKILLFLIVPLYTYFLTTTEYGEYDTLYSITNLIAPICTLAIHEGLLRWLLDSKEDDETVFSTGFLIYAILIIFTSIVLVGIRKITDWEYTYMLMFCLGTTTLNEVMQFSSRGAKKNVPFAISGIIQTITMVILNVLFIVYVKMGVNGMLLSYGISQLISSIYLIIVLRSLFCFQKKAICKSLAIEMILYSIMLVPNSISWWIMNSSDRIMLTYMIGATYTGVYSIATKFPSALTMIHTIFYRAWQEQAVLEYDSKTRDDYYSKIFNTYMKGIFCIVLVLIPISKIFIKVFMNTDYKAAYLYVGILMLGSIFSSFSAFYGTGYVSARDTKNATLTTMIGAVVNCTINLIFIKIIGVWAACISTLVGYMITWAVRIKQTKKYFNIKVNWDMFGLLLTFNLLYSLLNNTNEIYSSIFMIAIACFISIIVNKNEIGYAIKFIKKKIVK